MTERWARRTPDGVHVPRQGSAAMTWHEGEPTDEAFRLFRAALEPLELSGKLRGVLLQYHPGSRSRRQRRRARARARAARAPRPADRVPPSVVDGGGRARRHARVPRGPRARVRVASTPRTRAPRTSPRVAATTHPSPTCGSTDGTPRPGTSATRRARPTGSTGSTRPRSSRSGSRRSRGSRTRPRRSTRSSTTTATTSPRSAQILRGLLDEAGVPAAGGVEPPPTELTLF